MTFLNRKMNHNEKILALCWYLRNYSAWPSLFQSLLSRLVRVVRRRLYSLPGINSELCGYQDDIRRHVIKLPVSFKTGPSWLKKLPCTGWKPGQGPSLLNWSLPLAQNSLQTNKDKINWLQTWNDIEDVYALHRFIWLLRWMALKPSAEMLKEADGLIIQWINEMSGKYNHPSWQTYTASERVINWLLYLSCTKSEERISEKEIVLIEQSLRDHLKYITYHLEYHQGKFNNHILNNARALYIGGRLLENHEVANIGANIFQAHTDDLFTLNGFLREKSSHYQLLLCRTFTEVWWCAVKTNDVGFLSWIRGITKKIQKASVLFYPHSKSELSDIPRIGDLSPDVPLEWFYPDPIVMKNNAGSWYYLWDSDEITPFLLNLSKYYQGSKVADGEWLRMQFDKWNIIAPIYDHRGKYPTHHSHYDFGSFVLYYDGLPVFVDRGRHSYQNNKNGMYGVSSNAHNVAIMNGMPCLPPTRGIFGIYGMELLKRTTQELMAFYNRVCFDWSTERYLSIIGGTSNWTRTLKLTTTGINIKDGFSSPLWEDVFVEIMFHLDTRIQIRKISKTSVDFELDNYCFRISFELYNSGKKDNSNKKLSIKVVKSLDFPNYGQKKEGNTIVVCSDLNNAIIETRFTIL